MPWRSLLLLSVMAGPVALNAQVAASDTRRGTLVGTVYDSLGGAPIRGAMIQIVLESAVNSSALGTTTDGAGLFRFDTLAPGSYLVTFFHGKLDSLGLEPPLARVQVAPMQTARVMLGIPSARALVATVCRSTNPADSASAVTGQVRDADTGEPLTGATVTVRWSTLTFDRTGFRHDPYEVQATTGTSGLYWLCGVPAHVELPIRAAMATHGTPWIDLQLAPRALQRVDLAIGRSDSLVVGPTAADTTAIGLARVRGTVRTQDGQPLAGTQVFTWATGAVSSANEQGGFEVGGLPSGTQTIEFRRVGSAPKRMVVTLSRRAPTVLNVTLEKAVTLAPVEVRGQVLYSRLDEDIARRQRGGRGHIIREDELERRMGARLSDILRGVPGVRVVAIQGRSIVLMSRGLAIMRGTGCVPAIYLDNSRIWGEEDIDWITVSNLRAVEVYRSAVETPSEFGGSGSCGAILLWTKIGPRRQPKK